MVQKVFGIENLWSNKILTRKNYGLENFGSNNFLGQKMFGPKISFNQKNVYQKVLGSKNVWTQQILEKRLFGPINKVKKIVKIGSVTADILLIWTNIAWTKGTLTSGKDTPRDLLLMSGPVIFMSNSTFVELWLSWIKKV